MQFALGCIERYLEGNCISQGGAATGASSLPNPCIPPFIDSFILVFHLLLIAETLYSTFCWLMRPCIHLLLIDDTLYSPFVVIWELEAHFIAKHFFHLVNLKSILIEVVWPGWLRIMTRKLEIQRCREPSKDQFSRIFHCFFFMYFYSDYDIPI